MSGFCRATPPLRFAPPNTPPLNLMPATRRARSKTPSRKPAPQDPGLLKIYSQNVCVLPVGGRETWLQPASLIGSVLLPIFLISTLHSSPLLLVSATTILLTTAFFCPVGYLLAAPLWAGSNLFSHDYKAERLACLADRLAVPGTLEPAYDVVLLQELFGCWYSDVHRLELVRLMKQRGYLYHAMPSCSLLSILPSFWANSGLAVFSRHPLSDAASHTFKNQLFYDYWLVNRGVLGATVDAPREKGGKLRVFSVHFGPPVSVLTFFSFVPVAVMEFFDK